MADETPLTTPPVGNSSGSDKLPLHHKVMNRIAQVFGVSPLKNKGRTGGTTAKNKFLETVEAAHRMIGTKITSTPEELLRAAQDYIPTLLDGLDAGAATAAFRREYAKVLKEKPKVEPGADTATAIEEEPAGKRLRSNSGEMSSVVST